MATSLEQPEPVDSDTWDGTGVSLGEVNAALARLRAQTSQEGRPPSLRTSVMTHVAWVPPEWLDAAERTLEGMAERHPSRTVILVPRPDAEGGIDAEVGNGVELPI